jgi:ABC-2 type transport system ATP-binding protein
VFAIHVENLVKTYDSRRVLDGVNLDMPEGEFYALMGPNGSGKTTLASIIAAVKTQDSGVVEVYGNKPAQAKEFIGYVPQENFSSPKLSGKENLVYFANLLGYSRSQANQLAVEVLKNVGLSEEADKRVAKYSGGMRKRLEVATAIFPGIKVLILDEPTTGLDPAARRSFFSMVQEIMGRKTSIILITHIGSDAELASRVGLIDNGKMIAEGAPDELKRKHADEDVITVETAVKADSVFSVLKGYSINGKVAESGTGYKIYSRNGDRVLADVVRSLDQAGHKVMRIEMARPTLEDVFFRLTERHLQEATG